MASIAIGPVRRRPLALRYHLGKLAKYRYLPQYYWYHKLRFGVDKTKFDISFCVFIESFINDQYGIRAFLSKLRTTRELCFIDIGRNHGLVFYYAMYHIMKHDLPVKVVNYYGIDPSPLKFVYFNFHDFLARRGIKINYHIIDRAVVFNGEPKVTLKYGESNFGNFHVSGSNYAERAQSRQSRYEYVEISVDTMQFDEIKKVVADNLSNDAIIVKIDCKNRTDHMFVELLDMLSAQKINYLVSAEQDGSSDRDLSPYLMKSDYLMKDARVLTTSRTS